MSLFQQFNLNPNEMKESVMQCNLNAVTKAAMVLILEQYMERERDAFIQAGSYERSEHRQDYRNGYQEPRELLVSLGRIQLRVPRTRSGAFSTSLFERYSRVDQAFTMALLEMVVNGVSTRKVSTIVETLCGESVSKSFVSSLTEKLDPVVRAWSERPLNVQSFLYVFMDAMYIKVREHSRVVSKAVYLATAISEGGHREVIGLSISEKESYAGWKAFIESLKARGLKAPRLVVSDAHIGLKQAIEAGFVNTSWQRCTVHFKRNLLATLPKKGMKQFMTDVRQLYREADQKRARAVKDRIVDSYQDDPRYEKALDLLEEGFDETTQFLTEGHLDYVQFTSSTNHLERLNQEIRRRERVIRIFPNELSAFRLIGAIVMTYEEKQRQKKPMKIYKDAVEEASTPPPVHSSAPQAPTS
jgi:putative transposase